MFNHRIIKSMSHLHNHHSSSNRFSVFYCVRFSTNFYKTYCSSADQQKIDLINSSKMVRVLNVAEKNDAAKSISRIMSGGRTKVREGFSKFNKIYEFDKDLPNFGKSHMIFTSVSGHLLDKDFPEQYRKWYACDPAQLFDLPVNTFVPPNMKPIARTLEKEIQSCTHLIIWTDCDREGENIGFEIIKVYQKVNARITVLRARFSQITNQAINRAISNLVQPDARQNEAVEVRRELDLRIGAAFTRYQTLKLKETVQALKDSKVVSYGSCQTPTLGFIVDRYLEIKNFVPQKFWYIQVVDEVDGNRIDFNWKRIRLFDFRVCADLYCKMMRNPLAKVISVDTRPTSKWRPQPMDTIALEKLASSKLKIGAKETMKIAEKLYQQGIISYPRTETNRFEKDINLTNLVQAQTDDQRWGAFANNILQNGPNPRNGKKSDQAHPPIHPLKHVTNLKNKDAKIYELIVRHFLACLSDDAKGLKMTVRIQIDEEEFEAQGLNVLHRNYLEVYIYEKWSDKELPNYLLNSTFMPKDLFQREGETSAPGLLTESELITLMEKHGIGTDATHAEHIDTVQAREYAEMNEHRRFLPRKLGLGLVNGYLKMGLELSKPRLRAALERDLQAICDNQRNSADVLSDQIRNYKNVFLRTTDSFNALIMDVKSAHRLTDDEIRNI